MNHMSISCIVLYGFNRPDVDVCLQTAAFCDQIVVVDFSLNGIDSGLVKKHKLTVVKCSPSDSFSQLRNIGANKAKEKWLFYLDPDERVSVELANQIKEAVKSKDYLAYLIPRKNYFLGKKFKYAGAWPDKVLRLIKKESLIRWEGILHEQPKIEGKIGELNEPLIHLTHQNIEQMAHKTINWSKLEAQLRLDAGHPEMSSWRFWRIMLTSFWNNFVKNKACLEGTEGVIEGIFQMFSYFFTYVRLWEMQQQPSLKEKYRQIDKGIIRQWQEKK
jgi:hypothetical protein